MAKITNDNIVNAEIMLDVIERENWSGEEVFQAFTDWHGTCLCTRDFLENLRDCEGWGFEEDDEEEFDEDE